MHSTKKNSKCRRVPLRLIRVLFDIINAGKDLLILFVITKAESLRDKRSQKFTFLFLPVVSDPVQSQCWKMCRGVKVRNYK